MDTLKTILVISGAIVVAIAGADFYTSFSAPRLQNSSTSTSSTNTNATVTYPITQTPSAVTSSGVIISSLSTTDQQAYNLGSNIAYGTPLSGNGSATSPFMPESNGTFTWQGNGYYDFTISNVMGVTAGVKLVTNQSFITSYNENAKILGY